MASYGADGKPVLCVKKTSEIKDRSCEVDGVTGATLTSVGVSNMLQEGFAKYRNYLKK